MEFQNSQLPGIVSLQPPICKELQNDRITRSLTYKSTIAVVACSSREISLSSAFPMSSNPAAAEILPLNQKRRFKLPRIQEVGLLVVILILGLILAAYGQHDAHGGANTFLNLDNLVGQIATYMAVYAIMAVGQTFVIITGGIDISVGSIFALSAMVCADVMAPHGPGERYAEVCRGGAARRTMRGTAVRRNQRSAHHVGSPSSVHRYARDDEYLPVRSQHLDGRKKRCPIRGERYRRRLQMILYTATSLQNRTAPAVCQLMPLVVTLAVVAVGWFYLRLTVAGRENYAIGGNEEAARFSGIQ